MIPGVNEAAIALGTHAGKETISALVKKMFKRAENIENKIDDYFKIDGQEMTILCPESKQKYSMVIIPKAKIEQSEQLLTDRKLTGLPNEQAHGGPRVLNRSTASLFPLTKKPIQSL
jgi:hypothetical protein